MNKLKKKEDSLVDKWQSYTGTGVTSNKKKNSLALREAIGGGQFAIVKLYGGCFMNSRMEVVEEIDTAERAVAEKRFRKVSEELGYELQPLRDAILLFQ